MPNSKFFEKEIDFRSRKSMTDFLRNHFRYYTANSWNRLTSYANKVKLYDLDLPEEIRDKAYDFWGAEHDEFNWDVDDMIDEFKMQTGYDAGFNGRSSGYLVLYDTERGKDNKLYPICASIDSDGDYEHWSLDELKGRAKLVQQFDRLCDEIRELFIYYVSNSVIKQIPRVHTEMVTVAEMAE